jgi:hypothetical protein
VSDQQQEINLDVARLLGRIEAGVEAIKAEQSRVAEKLEEHTKSDSENFTSISGAIASITGSRGVAAKWGGLLGALVAGIASALSAYAGN